jgi:hypothetical protein
MTSFKEKDLKFENNKDVYLDVNGIGNDVLKFIEKYKLNIFSNSPLISPESFSILVEGNNNNKNLNSINKENSRYDNNKNSNSINKKNSRYNNNKNSNSINKKNSKYNNNKNSNSINKENSRYDNNKNSNSINKKNSRYDNNKKKSSSSKDDDSFFLQMI